MSGSLTSYCFLKLPLSLASQSIVIHFFEGAAWAKEDAGKGFQIFRKLLWRVKLAGEYLCQCGLEVGRTYIIFLSRPNKK